MQEEDFEKGDAELQAGEAIDADKQQLVMSFLSIQLSLGVDAASATREKVLLLLPRIVTSW